MAMRACSNARKEGPNRKAKSFAPGALVGSPVDRVPHSSDTILTCLRSKRRHCRECRMMSHKFVIGTLRLNRAVIKVDDAVTSAHGR